MAVNMSIEYNLKIASFYEDGNLLYQGVTKTKFLGDQWILLNHRQEAIAAFSIKRKFLSLNARIIVDFNTAKNELERPIKLKTADIRKQHKIKLPDAIIAATAIIYDLILNTRNTKEFSGYCWACYG